jgi:hypothetical protein
MLCRENIEQFPVGSEWLLALNGPGNKPGMNKGDYVISNSAKRKPD